MNYALNTMSNFVFFWSHRTMKPGCLSNWWRCKFVVNGTEYNCTEQYMMAQKAMLFGDTRHLQDILSTADPKRIKELGRMVENFDARVWDKHKAQIMFDGCYAKFSQNQELRDYICSFGNEVTFVEASPYDRVWGIGLRSTDPRAQHPEQWLGQNLLGQTLTLVQHRLLQETAK